MSALRSFLRIKPVNHLARAVGRLVLPGTRYRVFDRRLPLVDPFRITLPNGQHIEFEPFGDICSKFLRFDGWNGYEAPSIELFYALARHAEVCFDVGAYLGYFGLVAATARAGNRSYLFEAVPRVARFAARIAARNAHLGVQVVSGAVARESGTITLYLPEDPLDSDTSTAANHRPNRTPTPVPAISLDDFVRQQGIDRVDLLKIDTETTEPDVLAGFRETLARCRPTFVCEVLPTANVAALEDFCGKNHYAVAAITSGGLVARDRIVPDPTLKDLNYLFYPEDFPNPVSQETRRLLRK